MAHGFYGLDTDYFFNLIQLFTIHEINFSFKNS